MRALQYFCVSMMTTVVLAGCVSKATSREANLKDTGETAPNGYSDDTTTSDPIVIVDRSVSYQTLKGFGASIGWYAEALVAHQQKDRLYQKLFPDLGLDILRLRNRFSRGGKKNNVSAEREILNAATQRLGHAPLVLMTSWSPPAALKANGQELCEKNSDCTLKRNASGFVYDEFADYWAESVAYYQSEGISPDLISIQNEPDFIPSSWEGCRFEATETTTYPGYNKALAAVAEKLAALPNPPGLLGPEVLGIHYNKLQTYLRALDQSTLVGVAHHLYEKGSDKVWDWRTPGPDSFLGVMGSTAKLKTTLPFYQTEFNTDEDEGIEGGFETAWLIHNSLAVEGAAAFLYWELFWVNEHRGLIFLEGPTDFTVRDHYYALAHYARFTSPGDRRIAATSNNKNVRATAFLSTTEDRLTVVLLNVGSLDRQVTLQLGDEFSANGQAFLTVFRPGETVGWQPAPMSADGSLLIPSRSVATITFD